MSDSDSELQHHSISLQSLVPTAWIEAGASIKITGYRCLRVDFGSSRNPGGPFQVLDVDGIRIVIFQGSLATFKSIEAFPTEDIDGNIHLAALPPQIETSPPGNHALILELVDPGANKHHDYGAQTKLAIGIGRSEWGPNFAHAKISEYELALPNGQVSIISRGLRNPMTQPIVDASPSGIESIRTIFSTLQSLSPQDRKVAELAFRWHADALMEDAHDSYLKSWIAIEVLGMNGETNIAPLKNLLASAYETTSSDVSKTLGLGLLFGLRSRIVHGGEGPSLHGAILDHVRAVFRDVARARLGLPSGRFAGRTAPEAIPLLHSLSSNSRQRRRSTSRP